MNRSSTAAADVTTAPPRSLVSRITAPLGIITLIAMVPLVFALRALFTGYDSFEPVLFAELYVLCFSTLWLGAPTLFRTVPRLGIGQFFTLVAAALLLSWLFVALAPQIGEPNYCGERYRSYSLALSIWPPLVYRCTSLPFGIVGGFVGWWLGYWTIKWWEARGEAA